MIVFQASTCEMCLLCVYSEDIGQPIIHEMVHWSIVKAVAFFTYSLNFHTKNFVFQQTRFKKLQKQFPPIVSKAYSPALVDSRQNINVIYPGCYSIHWRRLIFGFAPGTPDKASFCLSCTVYFISILPYGHWREKTCLRGFQKNETQTSLLSYRD